MRKIICLVALVGTMFLGALPAARAQQAGDNFWLQIEAQPDLGEAQDRARAYAGAFADVQGYVLSSGWYAIVLGPFPADEARARLGELRDEGLIPPDSFVADGSNFRGQFWPAGAAATPQPAPQPAPQAAAQPAADSPAAPVASAPPADSQPAFVQETPAEARRSEAQLTRDQREQLQEALKWQGFYSGAIDGDIGPGTRGAMADWQGAKGYEPTGVLTTNQRAALLDAVRNERAALGLADVIDDKAGIAITLPQAMIGAPRYDPPFAHYDQKDGSGVQVLLISEPGDEAALAGLYDVLQTLRIVPMQGARKLSRRSFEISASNDVVSSYSYAALNDGLIKGYMLVWKTPETQRMTRVLAAMKASFRPVGKHALDPASVPTPDQQRRDLMSGLEVRKPVTARTGFFVDDKGTVLTTDAVLKNCARITLGAGHDAVLAHDDKTLGLAVLTPKEALAPLAYAQFEGTQATLADPVAVAGYSYGGKLSAPVMTYGTLEGLTGLNGEQGLRRLALKALPGDAGGPVFDRGGAVLGMLLPRPDETDGRVLPDDVRYAASASEIVAALKDAGVTPKLSEQSGAMAPEDLSSLGADMAVLVQCWK